MPFFWVANYHAHDVIDQPLPASLEALMIYVIMATGFDRGFKFCPECASHVCAHDMPALGKWTKQTASLPGQALWQPDLASPVFMNIREGSFGEAYDVAYAMLGMYLVSQSNCILVDEDMPEDEKSDILADLTQHLTKLDFAVKVEPETGKFTLASRSDGLTD